MPEVQGSQSNNFFLWSFSLCLSSHVGVIIDIIQNNNNNNNISTVNIHIIQKNNPTRDKIRIKPVITYK